MIISRRSVVVGAADQVSCEVGGESVILALTSGTYYGLEAVGSRVWTLLGQPTRVDRLRDVLVREYEVDRERCERDLLRLLEALAAAGLIDVREEPPPE